LNSRTLGPSAVRLDDGFEYALGIRGGENAAVAIGAHAAGVRSAIAIVQGFVVLRRFERHHVSTVADHDKTDFLALEKFLKDERRAQRPNRRLGFRAVARDDHALTSSEAVGFHNDRKIEPRECIDRVASRRSFEKSRRGNAQTLHHFFRVDLTRLESRHLLGGPDNRTSTRAEGVHNAGRERRFRSDDGEVGM
jgi:hypothetical protein